MTGKEKLRDREIRKYSLGYNCDWPKREKPTKFNFDEEDKGDLKKCYPTKWKKE